MIVKHCGKVIERNGSSVVVEIAPDTACKGCGGCEQSSKSRRITVMADQDIEIGDAVEIEIDSKDAVKAGFIIFIFPVVGLLAGVSLAVICVGESAVFQIVVSGFAGALIPVFFIKKFFSQISLNRKVYRKL